MKKILVLSSFPAPYRVDVFKGLSEKYELDVFFGTNKDQNRSEEYFSKKDSFQYFCLTDDEDYVYFKSCTKHLSDYDLVLAYDWYLSFAIKVEVKCILLHIPYIINCDGAFIIKETSIMDYAKKSLKSFLIKNARLCMASGRMASDYFLHYGAKKQNIKIHNFSSLHNSDIAEYALTDEERQEHRINLNLSRKKMVLAVGQFIQRKGFDVLLEAWRDLDKDYQLVIVGGGDERDNYLKQIRDREYNNVKLINFMPKETIIEYYKASDLFVLPTREDIWGLVINEALSFGVPVISTEKCVAALELIHNGSNGYIIPVDDADQLYNKMESILCSRKGAIEQMGNLGIRTIKEYSIENVVRQHINCIESIVIN